MTVAELATCVTTIYHTIATVGNPVINAVNAVISDDPVPAVPIKKSVQANYIVCLEDGVKLKMLKRHLARTYGLTPDQYRKRWGLPADYPMTAPAYAAQRSALAKAIGLGNRPRPPRMALV
jgi:predicted transcriptional regulator